MLNNERPMILELLIAGHLNTYLPKPEPEVRQETQIVQVIEIEETEPSPPPEPTLEEKIKNNYYQCDTNTHFIRADTAECMLKPTNTPVAPQTPFVRPQNASQRTSGTQSGQYYQCAGWVASKRYVPAGWGNATNWKNAATRAGWTISKTPVAGAIGWRPGHVVYVEAVHGNTVTISERNYDWKNSVRTITIPTSTYTYLY